MKMIFYKNLVTYYILVFTPLVLLAYYSKSLESYLFVALLGVYIFVYSPLLDYYRLRNKSVINKKGLFLRFNPFLRFKYFKTLFFKS